MFYALIIVAAASRLLPHPPNFACVAAAGLFAGCYCRGWRAAVVPVAAMLLSDVVGHLLRIPGMGFYQWQLMVAVYAAMGLSVWVGRTLRDQRSIGRVAIATLATSTLFFLVSNGAVWLVSYSFDWAGLVSCYTAALPFFQHTVSGDFLYVGLMFGAMELAALKVHRLQPQVTL